MMVSTDASIVAVANSTNFQGKVLKIGKYFEEERTAIQSEGRL